MITRKLSAKGLLLIKLEDVSYIHLPNIGLLLLAAAVAVAVVDVVVVVVIAEIPVFH